MSNISTSLVCFSFPIAVSFAERVAKTPPLLFPLSFEKTNGDVEDAEEGLCPSY
jgi:hypothetical protein